LPRYLGAPPPGLAATGESGELGRPIGAETEALLLLARSCASRRSNRPGSVRPVAMRGAIKLQPRLYELVQPPNWAQMGQAGFRLRRSLRVVL